MDELNPNEAAAESQAERDSENAIVPDLTDVVDLSEIDIEIARKAVEATAASTEAVITHSEDHQDAIIRVPHTNEYTGGITENKSDYPGNRGY